MCHLHPWQQHVELHHPPGPQHQPHQQHIDRPRYHLRVWWLLLPCRSGQWRHQQLPRLPQGRRKQGLSERFSQQRYLQHQRPVPLMCPHSHQRHASTYMLWQLQRGPQP